MYPQTFGSSVFDFIGPYWLIEMFQRLRRENSEKPNPMSYPTHSSRDSHASCFGE